MPSRKPGEAGYCHCSDCKRDYNKIAKKRDRGTADPVDSENFWDRVHEYSDLRDRVKRSRR